MNPADEIEFVGHIDSICNYCKTKGYDFITMPLERERRMVFKCRKCKETFAFIHVTVTHDPYDNPCGAKCVVEVPVEHAYHPTPVTMRCAYRSASGQARFVMRQRDKINLTLVSW